MKLEIGIATFALLAGTVSAQPRGEERRGEERRVNVRAPAPRFQAHPPGAHPHGPMVRPHPTRVLGARVVGYGGHQWKHWEHAEFARPLYYWEWNNIKQVTCVAEDSYGDQYPVTENVPSGFGLNNMSSIEDDALDRCNNESGGDQSCYLATCSHF